MLSAVVLLTLLSGSLAQAGAYSAKDLLSLSGKGASELSLTHVAETTAATADERACLALAGISSRVLASIPNPPAKATSPTAATCEVLGLVLSPDAADRQAQAERKDAAAKAYSDLVAKEDSEKTARAKEEKDPHAMESDPSMPACTNFKFEKDMNFGASLGYGLAKDLTGENNEFVLRATQRWMAQQIALGRETFVAGVHNGDMLCAYHMPR